MGIYSINGVVNSTPEIVRLYSVPVTITVIPAASTTALVEVSTSDYEELEAGGGFWKAWPLGAVSELTSDGIKSPAVALRVSRASGSGDVIWEVNQL